MNPHCSLPLLGSDLKTVVKLVIHKTVKAAIQAPQRVVSNKNNHLEWRYYDYQGMDEWIPPGLPFDEKMSEDECV